jgi:hypothetical protein
VWGTSSEAVKLVLQQGPLHVQVCAASYFVEGATIHLPFGTDSHVVLMLRACLVAGSAGAPGGAGTQVGPCALSQIRGCSGQLLDRGVPSLEASHLHVPGRP